MKATEKYNLGVNYLVMKDDSKYKIEEISILKITEMCCYVRFHYPNNSVTPYYYEWFYKSSFDTHYSIVDIIKATREDKLTRVLKKHYD